MRPRRRYVQRTLPAPPGTEIPGQRELLAVREIVHAFLHADRPEEAFQFALDRVGPVVGASFASVYVLDGASELMRLVAAHNWPESLRPWLADVRVRVGFGPSGEAASERRVIEVPDVFADPDLEDWQDVARELGFTALVALPLQAGGAATGAVAFYFKTWDDFTGERRGLLRLVADLMATATEKSRLLDRVRRAEAAAADALTELDGQYVMVASSRRAGREFVESAVSALGPVLDAIQGAHPGVSEARRVVDDLVLLADIAEGLVTPSPSTFDPRFPLREAMRMVVPADPRVQLVAEEPIHDLPALHTDAEKVSLALARLLARALATASSGAEVRATITAIAGRVVYRVPGREGDDLGWRVAAAVAGLLGATLETEITEAGATVLFALTAVTMQQSNDSP
jgi:GAF domain-containing protein